MQKYFAHHAYTNKTTAALPKGWAPSSLQALLLPIHRLHKLSNADNMFHKTALAVPPFMCMGCGQLPSAEESSSEIVAVSNLSVLKLLGNAEVIGFGQLDFRH